MSACKPEDLHRLFAERASAGDLSGMLALYEEHAYFVAPDGAQASGKADIERQLGNLIALRPSFTTTTERVVVAADVALVTTRWQVVFADYDGATAQTPIQGASTEVARRQPDGSWLYVIDSPRALVPALPL